MSEKQLKIRKAGKFRAVIFLLLTVLLIWTDDPSFRYTPNILLI